MPSTEAQVHSLAGSRCHHWKVRIDAAVWTEYKHATLLCTGLCGDSCYETCLPSRPRDSFLWSHALAIPLYCAPLPYLSLAWRGFG